MKKKIMTIVGTRPELIRLSEIIKLLDKLTDHCFVHTGQNFDPYLHEQFFDNLELRLPDYQLNKEKFTSFKYIGYILNEIEIIIDKEKPEAILILGDTNSGLTSYVAKRKGIPIFHMEAGNRCYDEKVPEEANRRIIDSLSTYLLPYTQRSREILLTEGYHPSKIIVTGNPITEILSKYQDKIGDRKEKNDYILVTIHRDENVTNKDNIESIFNALNKISEKEKVILSVHPKLNEMMKKFGIKLSKNILASNPFGFIDFLNYEKFAKCVLSDSGTVPEECAIFKTPCVLLRTSTERPELLENNSIILSGVSENEIINSMEVAINTNIGELPQDYKSIDVSEKIVKLLLRHINN